MQLACETECSCTASMQRPLSWTVASVQPGLHLLAFFWSFIVIITPIAASTSITQRQDYYHHCCCNRRLRLLIGMFLHFWNPDVLQLNWRWWSSGRRTLLVSFKGPLLFDSVALLLLLFFALQLPVLFYCRGWLLMPSGVLVVIYSIVFACFFLSSHVGSLADSQIDSVTSRLRHSVFMQNSRSGELHVCAAPLQQKRTNGSSGRKRSRNERSSSERRTSARKGTFQNTGVARLRIGLLAALTLRSRSTLE